MYHRHHRPSQGPQAADSSTKGLILRGGWRYDLTTWVHDALSFRGAFRKLRQQTLTLAQLQEGSQVLDVGCGTGTLALDVVRRVGPAGRVAGIDPSSRQIARASAKAARRGFSADFQIGVIEQLPFAEHTFDVVFSTLMMHHLPVPLKQQGLAEIARVLKPGGRLILADFTHTADRAGRTARFHAGGSRVQDLVARLAEAGFTVVDTEEVSSPPFSAFPGASLIRADKS